jgi:predicted nucleic acid-binding protein
MLLVADSSALIALSICDALSFLEILFTSVKVPESVYNEVIKKGKKDSLNLQKFLEDKIEKISIDDYVITDSSIEHGELSAMALYKKLGADKLLLDDKRARKIAVVNKISIIGSSGILLRAKKKNLITNVKPYLDKIKASDIFLSDKLYNDILDIAGEI